MNQDIKFSVTVPAYKAQFLAECIDSILAQTYKNFELIIVNDASPQDLDSIVSKYDDPRIRYYKNKVGFGAEHVVGNWNKCLEYATGDYIICMGDDDKLLPNCLEEYVKLIEKFPNSNVYHARTQIIDENNNIISLQEGRPISESVLSAIWNRLVFRRQFIGDWLFKTKELEEIGGYFYLPFAWGSDDMTVYYTGGNKPIINMQEYGFQYRVNIHTISNDTSSVGAKILSNYKQYCLIGSLIEKPRKNWEDEVYCQMIKQELWNNYNKAISRVLSLDIRHKPFHFIKWLLKAKNYHLNYKILFKSLIYSIS